MVRIMPAIVSRGFSSRWISASVSSRPASPSSAKYSVCTGTITRSAATSALTVSGPSDGGQSSSVKAIASRTSPSASRSRVSEPARRGSSTLAPARSGVEGTAPEALDPGRAHGVGDRHVAAEARRRLLGSRSLASPSADRGVALRVDVDEQRVVAGLRDAGRDVDGGRRLADPALLVGDRVDGAHGLPKVPRERRKRSFGLGVRRRSARSCPRLSRAGACAPCPARRGKRSGVGPTLQ